MLKGNEAEQFHLMSIHTSAVPAASETTMFFDLTVNPWSGMKGGGWTCCIIHVQ